MNVIESETHLLKVYLYLKTLFTLKLSAFYLIFYIILTANTVFKEAYWRELEYTSSVHSTRLSALLFHYAFSIWFSVQSATLVQLRVTSWKQLFWVDRSTTLYSKVYTAYSHQQRCMLKPCSLIPCLFCLHCDSEIPAVASFSHQNAITIALKLSLMRVTDGSSSVTMHPLLSTKKLLYCTLNHMHLGNSDA